MPASFLVDKRKLRETSDFRISVERCQEVRPSQNTFRIGIVSSSFLLFYDRAFASSAVFAARSKTQQNSMLDIVTLLVEAR